MLGQGTVVRLYFGLESNTVIDMGRGGTVPRCSELVEIGGR